MIRLTSSEGLFIVISVAAAMNSEFINAAFGLDDDDYDFDPTTGDLQLDCSRLEFRTLASVVQYLEYYATTPMLPTPDPIPGAFPVALELIVPQLWYRDFVIGLGLPHM
jgi:hypothetical protein